MSVSCLRLPADSSQQRGYGHFGGVFGAQTPILCARATWIRPELRHQNHCAPKDRIYLQSAERVEDKLRFGRGINP